MRWIICKASRESLALPVNRRLQNEGVRAALTDPFVTGGQPADIRSHNGLKFSVNAVQQWFGGTGMMPLSITHCSPAEPCANGYCQSFGDPRCATTCRRRRYGTPRPARKC